MKKILTMVCVLCTLPFYAQHKVADNVEALVSKKTAFSHFSPLNESNSIRPRTNVVKNATYATIDSQMVKHIADTKPENIEIEIPYNGVNLTIQLYRAEIFAPGFHVDTDKQRAVDYVKGAYYRGMIKGDSKSLASFNFFQDEMNGMVSSANLSNLVVDRLRNEDNMTDYIIYSDSQLTIANKFNCATDEPEKFGPKNNNNQNTTSSTNSFDNIFGVKIYFEMDYQLFQANNGSPTQTSNWMTSVFNNIQTLYANDNISVSLSSFFYHTSVDPYSTNVSSNQNLTQFFTNAFIDGDIGQLIGIDPGGQGGLAYLRGLCGLNASYCDVDLDFEDVPVYSWTIQAMTHEIGHQLGSPHTHACAWNGNNTPIDICGAEAGYSEGCTDGPMPWEEQGTIMSYCHLTGVGINLANGFGPQPRELIVDYINSRTCLELLGVEENVFADFSYFPNPSKGLINITSGNGIEEISVYNIAGQLLLSQKVNGAEATIDLSPFNDGVYFFKAVSSGKEMNFKVIKQN